MPAHRVIHDPAVVEGTDDKKALAFNQAFCELHGWLKDLPARFSEKPADRLVQNKGFTAS
jgi:hypothetical protein